MTYDNDLIRRGAVLDAMCKGPRTVQDRIDIIRAIPPVAASQTADPATNADSCQRVAVKPLVWEEVNPGVFVAESSLGVWSRFDGHYMRPDASGGIASDNPEAAAQADYAARIIAAIDVQPDPRDAQIAALVDAIENIRVTYLLPPSFQLPLDLAIAAVKGGDA